jgi:dTDP-4-dehydrorhamnose 3,5-epimerase
MTFEALKLSGAFIIKPDKLEDERGFFALIWSADLFAQHGLEAHLAECNVSFNLKKATVRGMHYQAPPHEQVKLVRCTAGGIYDCIIDLRPNSPTFKQWAAVELTANNRTMMYVPKGFAHGFQTLEHNSEVLYQMSEVYAPKSGRGVRWNDPAFGITWPGIAELVINERDRTYPDFGTQRERR